MKNVLEVVRYTKTEITMKIISIIIGALMFINKCFLITVIKFYEHVVIQKKNISENFYSKSKIKPSSIYTNEKHKLIH